MDPSSNFSRSLYRNMGVLKLILNYYYIQWYFFLNGRNCQDSRTWTPGNKAIDHRELQDNWGSAFHCGFPLGRAVNQFLKTLLHRYRTEVWPSLLSSRSLSAFSSPSSPGIKLFASASSTTSTRLKLPSVWLMEFRKKQATHQADHRWIIRLE